MPRGPRPRLERPLRILLVEDDPDDAVITRWALARALPCDVEIIGDGAEAIARLTSAADDVERPPDLIVLDLGLPRRSGLEVLRHIRNVRSLDRTPVMVLTNERDDDQKISDAYAWGTNTYFTKPATRDGFAEALRLLAMGVSGRAKPSSTVGDRPPSAVR